jgi:hypothetical protein
LTTALVQSSSERKLDLIAPACLFLARNRFLNAEFDQRIPGTSVSADTFKIDEDIKDFGDGNKDDDGEMLGTSD